MSLCRYQPGTVIIFKSSKLFHGVTSWRPKGGINMDGILPGRRAHVLYTGLDAYEKLKTMTPGHLRRTNGGMNSDQYIHERRTICDHPLFNRMTSAYQSLRSIRSRLSQGTLDIDH